MSLKLPEFNNKNNIFENNRNVYEGYQRGWGLQFGGLRDQVKTDPLYKQALKLVAGRAIIMEENLMNIFLIIKFFLPKLSSQNIIEFGSYRGGSAIFMAHCSRELYPEAKVYALDSYEGMPPTDDKVDLHQQGDFSNVDLDEIKSYASSLKLENIIFVKGLFEDTLPAIQQDQIEFGLAHIDCDIYSGVSYSQHAIYSNLSPGGYVVYDDACVSSCIGATQAVEEFIINNQQHSEQIWPHFVFRKAL